MRTIFTHCHQYYTFIFLSVSYSSTTQVESIRQGVVSSLSPTHPHTWSKGQTVIKRRKSSKNWECFLISCLRYQLMILQLFLQMQIVEDLHAARIEKKMDLPVVQACGELTCMEIDLADDESHISSSKLICGRCFLLSLH